MEDLPIRGGRGGKGHTSKGEGNRKNRGRKEKGSGKGGWLVGVEFNAPLDII